MTDMLSGTPRDRRPLSDLDHQMIAAARRRAQVTVTRNDFTRTATLVAWHPGNKPRVRVLFDTSNAATFPARAMTILDEVTP